MASKGVTIQTSVMFNGTQAINTLDQLRKRAEGLKAQMASLKATLGEDYQENAGFQELNKELQTTTSLLNSGTQKLNYYAQAMNDMSGMTVRQMEAAQTQAKRLMRSFSDNTPQEEVAKVVALIEKLTTRIKQLKTGYTDAMESSKNTTGMAYSEMERLVSALREEQKIVANDPLLWNKYGVAIEKVTNEMRTLAETTPRTKSLGVLLNLDRSSTEEIQNAIKYVETLKNKQVEGSKMWEYYSEMVNNAKEHLKGFEESTKLDSMNKQFQNLTTLSESALSEQKKYWEGAIHAATPYSQELDAARQKLEAIQQLERNRMQTQATNVIGNLDNSSEKEIRDSIKALQELRQNVTYGSDEWKDMGVEIKKAEDYLKNFDAAARQNTMVQQFSNLQNLSVSALSEQKKYWTEMLNAARPYSGELDDARQKLEAIQQLEQTRTKSDATKVLTDIQSGSFTGTINETKEAIQLLEKYRSLLDVKDVSGITTTEEAIAQLNRMLADSNNQWASYQDAIRAAKQIGEGTFSGTYQDLEKIRKSLLTYKAQLNTSDITGLNQINKALRQIDIAQNQARNGFVNINDVMDNLKTVPLDRLQLAAKQLEERLTNATRGTDEYIRESAQLRQIRAQIEQTNRAWQNQENIIIRTSKRLSSYVLVYAGFNEVVGQVKKMVSANLDLSDSLADIQKTTGLSSDAINELSKSIDSIDTRTSQQQLHELAAVAGQIGLTSKEDVLGFVKASNMITVSLNELGSEGTASLMKLAQLTGDVQKMGVEKSLLAIGGSINELSASSAATAGPIVDLMNRLGGIAAQSHISTAELAAIGATADALGQSMEITGTSMSKFIATLLSSSDKVAYAVNMDAKALRDMIDSGRTMDAIIAVMQKMNEMGGIANLAPIMGDLGSEGARMMTMLSAMANNVDFLTEQVDLSREAFIEATSIQNEYNVKNENAIAILQRMGNAMKEAFVNSGVVSALKAILSATMNVFSWFAKGETTARTLVSVIIGLTTALLANRLAWVKNLNAMTRTVIYAKITGWISTARISLIAFGKSMLTASTYTNMATLSVNKLKVALNRNWLTLVIGALAAIGTYLYKTYTYVSDLTKAQAKYNAELESEIIKIDSLFYALDRYNKGTVERKKIIDQINKQYGDYLGFMLSEKDSAEKLASAHKLVNAELKKKMALSLQSKLEENINEQFSNQLNELMTSMGKALAKARGIGEQFSREAIGLMSDIVRDNVNKPIEEIQEIVKQSFGDKYGRTGLAFGFKAYFSIEDDVKEFIKARKDYQNAVQMTTDFANREIQKTTDDTVREGVNMLNRLTHEYNKLKKTDISILNEEEEKSHYKELLNAAQNYVSAAERLMEGLTDKSQYNMQNVVNIYKAEIEEIKKKMPVSDDWGKGLDIKGWKESFDNINTASIENLVKVYKELQDAPKLISDVAKYNKMFGTSFTDLAQVMEDTRNKAKLIKEELASRGRNTAGNFLWGKNKTDRSEFAEAKREYEVALSALESYYNSRETLIREQAIKENETEEELQRNLNSLEEMHLKARIAMRKKLLNKEDNSFENNYAEITQSVYFNSINLNNLSDQLGKFGKQMTQGVERQMTEDEVKLLAKAWKIRQEIAKVLLSYDYVGTTDKNFQDAMEKLNLFWGEETERTQENADKRMAIFKKYSSEIYNMDADTFKQRLAQEEMFGSIVEDSDQTRYNVLLQKLYEFHDQQVEAEKKTKDRRLKIINELYKNSDTGKKAKTQEASGTENVNYQKSLQSIGLGNERTMLDAEIELYRARLTAAMEYYDFVQKNGGDLVDAQQQVSDAAIAMSEKEMEVVQNKLGYLKEYCDSVVDFAAQMGEAAWGELEDRQEAGKQLLKTVQNITQKLLKDLALRAINSALFSRKSVEATEKEGEGQVNAAEGTANKLQGVAQQAALDSVNLGAKKVAADIVLGIAGGGAKTIGELGWWGIPLVAVITALLEGLLSSAMSGIASLFGSGATASASTKKLTTGMLTYAEGDYPVLGNDGQLYNARYQKELKTGIYGGGAHFGIFSEKKPEMIVDGDTTQRLVMNYPHIYDAITTIAKHGRLKNAAMPTYASGNYPSGMKSISATSDGSGAEMDSMGQLAQMQATIASMNATISALNATLANGVTATINPYANYKAEEKANRFMKKRGMKK